MSKFCAIFVAAFMLVIFAVSVPGIRVAQLELRVQPLPEDMPELNCKVEIRFNKRKTECPGRETTTYSNTRDEGLFGCIEAYDRFQAAYAFAIIGCILSVITALTIVLSIFVHLPAIIPRLLAICVFVAFTVSWPLSWAQTTSPACGRKLKDATFDNGARITNISRGHGLNCLVAAWALSFGGIAFTYFVSSHRKYSSIVNTVFGIEKHEAVAEDNAELQGKKSEPTVTA
eukprot:GILI01012371.1.p1 GENE.GILI01012371.1~~GILI01012371.1.p1  ORF type:complete len:230 (-),score=42.99 GILI01012371.1:284-973(-)